MEPACLNLFEVIETLRSEPGSGTDRRIVEADGGVPAALRTALLALPGVTDARVAHDVGSGEQSFPIGDTGRTLLLELDDAAAFGPIRSTVALAARMLAPVIREARAEQDLIEDLLLAQAARWTSDPIMILDRQFRVRMINDAFTRVFGIEREAAIGRLPGDLIYDRVRDQGQINEIRETLERGERFHAEIQNRTRSGAFIWVNLDIYPILTPEGEVAGSISIRHDISSRRQAEEAVARSEARFRDLMEIASDWYWETDADHRFIAMVGDWPLAADMTGLGHRRWELPVELVDETFWDRHRADLDARRPFRDLRYPVRTTTGEMFWQTVNGRPVFDEENQFIGYRGTGRDITVEMQARETVDRMMRALDIVDQIVALFDAEERLVFANSGYRHWVGDYQALHLGMTFEDILRGLARTDFYGEVDAEALIAERLRRFRDPSGPFEARRADRWFQIRDIVLDDGARLLVADDIDTRKRTEIELRAAKEQAEDANAAKTNFLARMSHELRTPLNAILGLSDMMLALRGRMTADKQFEYVEDIREAGRILLSHIEDVLDFARIDAGDLRLRPEAVDLRIAIARVMRIMRPIARQHGVRIRADLPRSMPSVLMDRRALEQTALNLLSNAVAHSPAGGWVAIEAGREDNRACITVMDSGCGIPPEELDKVFEPFHQVGSPDVARQAGTGLGLAIVKQLLERSGGDIRIASEVGKGTRVTFSLPLTDRLAA